MQGVMGCSITDRLTPGRWKYEVRAPRPTDRLLLDTIALAADFPASDHQDWVALVTKTLKGGAPEDLTWTSRDGVSIEALHLDAPALPEPVRFSGLRSQGAGRWDLRTVISHADPAAANRQALQDLENGASSLLLRLDATGADGVAIGSGDDLARALAGVELELAPVALDAGFLGPWAGEWLHRVARSAPRAKLQLHLDPLSAFARTGDSPGPVAAHLAHGAGLAARLHETYPDMTAFLASGQIAHEAGASEAEELAVMLSAALAYLKALDDQGVAPAAAAPMIMLGLAADAEYFVTVAKHRAARALWARVLDALDVISPARIETRSSRRMLSRLDAWVNLLRLTAAGFGAAVGGAEALVLEPFTQPLGPPTDFARRQARNAQLVLMEESGLARVNDPAGGCWFLESLTDQLTHAAWKRFQEIEAQGGLAAALAGGLVAGWAEAGRVALTAEVASGARKLIGASIFRSPGETPVAVDAIDGSAFARPAPDVRLPGDDDRGPPLRPWRLTEALEETPA
jgi:methylmalonyl-CoA mutase